MGIKVRVLILSVTGGLGATFSYKLAVQYKRRQIVSSWSPQIQSVLLHSSSNHFYLKYCLRLLQLVIIFLPSVILSFMAFIPYLRAIWTKILLKSVEMAGFVFIKGMQYLSHRKDIVGQEFARQATRLRENVVPEQFQSSLRTVQSQFGKKISQVFQSFQTQAAASGSVSCVYRAVLKGKKVMVKVRRDLDQEEVRRDINLIFWVSGFLGRFSGFFKIPVPKQTLYLVMQNQLNFLKENSVFVNSNVTFPRPHPLSTRKVLVLDLIEGNSVGKYEQSADPANPLIAKLGASTFFQMLFRHNFTHSDCHGGNIMVMIQKANGSIRGRLQALWERFQYITSNRITWLFSDSPVLRLLCNQQLHDNLRLFTLQDSLQLKVRIGVLDAGMVIRLEPNKFQYFKTFLRQILEAAPNQCAQSIFKISRYCGQSLNKELFQPYYRDLSKMFQIVRKTPLAELKGIQIFKGLLQVIRNHKMTIDGDIALLLSNMLILEGLGKQLDSQQNLIRGAVGGLGWFNLLK